MVHALASGWGLAAQTLRYAPVGGGSYHWTVRDERGEQWFVTVDDLDGKGWLGRTRPAVFAGLAVAMDAAVALRDAAALPFVVAPVPALDNRTLHPLGARHAVAVFPFLHGTPGRWGEALPAPDRDELVTMLAALHRADPAAVRLPRRGLALSWRRDLEQALRELGQPWSGGPLAESARALLAGAAGRLRRRLDTLDRWAAAMATAPTIVITHGEPHPANTIRLAAPAAPPRAPASAPAAPPRARIMLIDWDTVGLAPPERDLWMVATDGGDELRRYTELTGRPVDTAAFEFYRLRWALDDLSCFVRDLRAPHRRTPGAEHAWRALELTVAQLAR